MGIFFLIIVLIVYFFEIKWRLRNNIPLNNGNPIDGGQFIIFWLVSSVMVSVLMVLLAMFMSPDAGDYLFKFVYSFFQLFFSDIYRGYTDSEPKIWQDFIPYIIETINHNQKLSASDRLAELNHINELISMKDAVPKDELALSNVGFYRFVLVIVTFISLFFGRKFIYSPFFEMQKHHLHNVNVLGLLLQILILLLLWVPVVWLVFLVPTHNTTCPIRGLAFWCMDLSGKGPRYFAFHTLFLFYWMFILMLMNASIKAVLTELGYKVKLKIEND